MCVNKGKEARNEKSVIILSISISKETKRANHIYIRAAPEKKVIKMLFVVWAVLYAHSNMKHYSINVDCLDSNACNGSSSTIYILHLHDALLVANVFINR